MLSQFSQNRSSILIHNLKRNILDLSISNLLRYHPSFTSFYSTQGKYTNTNRTIFMPAPVSFSLPVPSPTPGSEMAQLRQHVHSPLMVLVALVLGPLPRPSAFLALKLTSNLHPLMKPYGHRRKMCPTPLFLKRSTQNGTKRCRLSLSAQAR